MKYCSVKRCKPSAALLALLSLSLPAASQAEFSLNFQKSSSSTGGEFFNFDCNRGGRSSGGEGCGENDELRENNGRDTTPFLMQLVREPNTGSRYWHVIIGLPGDDFVQEHWIRTRNDRGGRGEDDDEVGPWSDSLGTNQQITNARDPLGDPRISGSGTANPNSTLFRQVINSQGMTQDITKAYYVRKHVITQDIEDGQMTSQFDLDMTNSTFEQTDIAGVMRASVNGFDVTDQAAGSYVTGGKYRFDRLNSPTSGGSRGGSGTSQEFVNEYSGEGAGYNIWEVDWAAYRNPAQNGCRSGSGGSRGNTEVDSSIVAPGDPIDRRCHLYGGSGEGGD